MKKKSKHVVHFPLLLWKKIKHIAHLLFLSGKSFVDNRGSVMAAAIAYYLMISVIPLIIIIIAVAGFIVAYNNKIVEFIGYDYNGKISGLLGLTEEFNPVDKILEFTYSFNPIAGEASQDFITKLADSKAVTSQIGFLGLLWSGSKIFQTLEEALNIAWHAPVRKFYKRWLVSFVVAVSLGCIPMVSVLFTVSANLIKKFGDLLYMSRPDLENLTIILNYVLPIMLSVVMFTFIYKILPNCKAHWRSCFVGGLTTGLLFEGAKQLFSVYVKNFANFDRLYGSIGGVIALVFWAYYAGIITVFGAEMSSQFNQAFGGENRDNIPNKTPSQAPPAVH